MNPVYSHGVSVAALASTDEKDKRLRSSVLIKSGTTTLVVDTTPDFRSQALRAPVDRVDAILYTHAHADHILGLDDVRPFNYRQDSEIPIYARPETLAAISLLLLYRHKDNIKRLMAGQEARMGRAREDG